MVERRRANQTDEAKTKRARTQMKTTIYSHLLEDNQPIGAAVANYKRDDMKNVSLEMEQKQRRGSLVRLIAVRDGRPRGARLGRRASVCVYCTVLLLIRSDITLGSSARQLADLGARHKAHGTVGLQTKAGLLVINSLRPSWQRAWTAAAAFGAHAIYGQVRMASRRGSS